MLVAGGGPAGILLGIRSPAQEYTRSPAALWRRMTGDQQIPEQHLSPPAKARLQVDDLVGYTFIYKRAGDKNLPRLWDSRAALTDRARRTAFPDRLRMSRKKTEQMPKLVLRLPDLDFAKNAVSNTLRSSESKRSYRFAIDDFVAWYCSEPRLSFNKTVVLRYRLELESRRFSSSSVNLRLAAVRRLAYEAADTGLLSPELAAGIQRVKGAKRIGVKIGNWLSADQAKALVQAPDVETMRGKRDHAIISILVSCGLRR